MAQTFNWTERERIRREHAEVTLVRSTNPATFTVELDLSDYALRADAKVVVEAYRQTTYRRFALGSVALVRAEEPLTLDAFADPDAVMFRVKVLSPDEADGRILAEADRLRVVDLAEHPTGQRPLLRTKGEDLGAQAWRLSMDEGSDGPLLLVNNQLGDWRQAARTPQFRLLVYPELMRQILSSALQSDGDSDEGWQRDWIDFAEAMQGVGEAPLDDATQDVRDLWIADAVEAFCRKHELLKKYAAAISEGDAL